MKDDVSAVKNAAKIAFFGRPGGDTINLNIGGMLTEVTKKQCFII